MRFKLKKKVNVEVRKHISNFENSYNYRGRQRNNNEMESRLQCKKIYWLKKFDQNQLSMTA